MCDFLFFVPWPSACFYFTLFPCPFYPHLQGGKPKKAEEKDRKEAAADEVVPLMADEGGADSAGAGGNETDAPPAPVAEPVPVPAASGGQKSFFGIG